MRLPEHRGEREVRSAQLDLPQLTAHILAVVHERRAAERARRVEGVTLEALSGTPSHRLHAVDPISADGHKLPRLTASSPAVVHERGAAEGPSRRKTVTSEALPLTVVRPEAIVRVRLRRERTHRGQHREPGDANRDTAGVQHHLCSGARAALTVRCVGMFVSGRGGAEQ